MRSPRMRGTLLVVVGLATGSAALSAPVVAQDRRSIETGVTTLESDAGEVLSQTLVRDGYRSQKTADQRLSDGRVLLGLKSYVPASLVLTDVVENHPTHASIHEARYLLGEALFGAGDYLGARTRFREVIAHADEPAVRPFASRALGRLIEIAIRTHNFDGVDEYFERMNRLPSQEVEAAATYFKAKFIYNKAVTAVDLHSREGKVDGKVADAALLAEARQGFEAVAESSPYHPQARYFVGVILALQGQNPQAIEAFSRVLRMPVNTPEHQKVQELARLALGRLYYETDQLALAIETYEAIPAESPHFDTALYEIAWVHIRARNTESAEQALGTLVSSAPDSSHVADGIVLRGNLLLRNGELEEATEVFAGASAGYSPVRESLNAIVAEHADTQGYFRTLVREHVDDFAVGTVLPQSAVPFGRDEYELARATEVMEEMASLRKLVAETETIIRRFNDALAADNRANIYPDSRRLRMRTTGVLNRATVLRQRMIKYVESKGGISGEGSAARSERKALDPEVAKLPQTEGEFFERDKQPLEHYRVLGRELRGIETEIYSLEAKIAGAERFVRESAALRTNPEGVAAVEAELKGHRKAVELYRQTLADAANTIEAGRMRVGVDDERYMADRGLRQRYREVVDRELGFVGGARNEIDPLYQRVGALEAKVDSHDRFIDGVLAERHTDLTGKLQAEGAILEGHRQRLTQLETEAEDVVGGATYIGFTNVRQRVYDLVLRADVGGVDVRWAEREKHRLNVERLTRDRAREIEALDNEYNEIMGRSKGDEQ
jgi:TolA-binding protein